MESVAEEPSMKILEKTARFAAVAFAVLFIVLSLVGIFGAWFVNRKASDVALKGFGVIEMGVGVVDAGVGRWTTSSGAVGRKCRRRPRPSALSAHKRCRTVPCSMR